MHQPAAAVLILTGSSELADELGTSSIPHFETMLKTASPRDVLNRVADLLAQEQAPYERTRNAY
jgi:hypothetical protein